MDRDTIQMTVIWSHEAQLTVISPRGMKNKNASDSLKRAILATVWQRCEVPSQWCSAPKCISLSCLSERALPDSLAKHENPGSSNKSQFSTYTFYLDC